MKRRAHATGANLGHTLVWTFLLLLWPAQAQAHLVSTRFGELYSGMLHPLMTLIHVVPWLALGLLAGLQRTATARNVLWGLPVCVMVGAWVGIHLPEHPLVTTLNLASFVALGALVALARPINDSILVSLTAVFGISHGVGNAAPELQGTGQWLYLLGLGISAYVLVALVTALAHVVNKQPRWGNIALRAVGSWIVAIGLIVGGFSLVTPP